MTAERVLPIALCLLSCGGAATSAPPAEAPSPSPESQPTSPAAPAAPAAAPSLAPAAGGDAATPTTSGASARPAIAFAPHATVDQAIQTVPQGLPRLNMSNDALQAPLLDLKRYDRCKVPRSTKVTISVAVFDGAAVGVDVATKPKNARMEECLDVVVRSMTWEKVPSLNQATATF